MSSKKKMKRNHSRNKLKEHKSNSHLHWKLFPLEEPDVSRISKVADGDQLEELDDSFDHPLHSTAVDAYGEKHLENESLGHASAQQRKKAEKSKKLHRSRTSDGDIQRNNAAGPEDKALKENVALNTAPSWMKKRQPSEENTSSDPSVDSPRSVEVWCPKKLKRSSRDITELDVVLVEIEKVAANYRQNIESHTCRKAVDGFCSAIKDQITDLIVGVQELKNTKKKNAKALTDIKEKRQRLFQLREDLIGAEPQLTQLQREYAEVQERKSSLKQATELLTDLKELFSMVQHGWLDCREENPEVKVVYGTSSLPALLVESQGILGAEKHFQNINKKLEEALTQRKGKLSERH